MKRFIFLVVGLILLFGILFLIGRSLGWLDAENIRTWLEEMQKTPDGQWTVAGVIILLLAVDLFFPIPSSLLMALSGMFYGIFTGALVAFTGSMAAVTLGFFLCRWGGRRVAEKIVEPKELDRVTSWLETYGTAAIIISRPVPMLTEVLSCLAGISKMRKRNFFLAMAVGHFPVCLFFSYIGSRGKFDDPWPAITVALLMPAVMLYWFRRHNKLRKQKEKKEGEHSCSPNEEKI